MRVYLLRHGQSEANVAGVISDDPAHVHHLTSLGLAQARATAGELAGVAFAHVYVSRHARTRETAEAMLEVWRRPVPVSVDARIDERHSGLDGRPVEAFNGLVRPDPVNIKPPHGESFREQMARVRAFLDAAAKRHGAATILVVSHENPIQAARAAAGLDPEVAVREALGNCAWVVLDWPPAEGG